MWVSYSVHEQGDPEVFGRQLGPQQGVEQGGSAAVDSLIHHPAAIALAIQHFLVG